MRNVSEKSEALAELRACGREQRFSARQTIFARGDAGDVLGIIESGVVRISVFGMDGRELALALLGPGDVIGEISVIDARERAADVIAVGQVTITQVSASDARHLLYTNRAVTDFFFELLCDRIRSANAHAESQALNSLAGRLSIFFINNGEEQDDGTLSLPNLPSQSELARLVGGARESVNRQFRVWRDAGLLVPEDRGYVITDPVRLQEDAVFS